MKHSVNHLQGDGPRAIAARSKTSCIALVRSAACCAGLAAGIAFAGEETNTVEIGFNEFNYDGLNRLISVKADWGLIVYSYDKAGNITNAIEYGTAVLTNANTAVAVSKTANTNTVMAGQVLTYTIRVMNLGPDPSPAVTMVDRLPPSTLQQAAHFSQGEITLATSNLIWDIGVLAAGQSVTLVLEARPMQAGLNTNQAVLTASGDSTPGDNLASVVTLVTAPDDTDGDGMPDWWELVHFGSSTGGVAQADVDRDGHSNLTEYFADTDPQNNHSTFLISSVNQGATQAITFDSSPVRFYDLQFSSDFNIWSNLVADIQGLGDAITVIDTNRPVFRLYRMRVRTP